MRRKGDSLCPNETFASSRAVSTEAGSVPGCLTCALPQAPTVSELTPESTPDPPSTSSSKSDRKNDDIDTLSGESALVDRASASDVSLATQPDLCQEVLQISSHGSLGQSHIALNGVSALPSTTPALTGSESRTWPASQTVSTILTPTPSLTASFYGGSLSLTASPPLEKEPQSSQIRLSFDSSGGARILVADEPTPSPPRSHPLAPTPFKTRQTLRRSYSAAGLSDFRSSVRSLSKSANNTPSSVASEAASPRVPAPPRIPTGRSRDSRAWEFWCDASARQEHKSSAERESHGNAVDAIHLIRSRSLDPRRVGVLTPNLSRANTAEIRNVKRQKMHDEKLGSKQQSKKSSHQSHKSKQAGHGHGQHWGQFASSKKPIPDGDEAISIHSESEKENREPGVQRTREPLSNTHRHRPVLGVSRTVPSLSTAGRKRSKLGLGIQNASFLSSDGRVPNGGEGSLSNPDDDEEIAQFMRAGRNNEQNIADENGHEDEMVVQGLLSLSQGNWQ